MKEKLVPSAWLEKEGRRLDCGPYLSGAIEAKLLLEELSVSKEPLSTLTRGHEGGIYNGPHFQRNYVSDMRHGVPFLSTSSMLHADLSRVEHLSKKDATSPKLRFLRIDPGMILVSCSGTVGRMVFTREDMAGFWSSQDIMKVVPDPSRIESGYLYAYLASRYGIPLIAGGTYGAIIQHIEPEHLHNLPVPRLGAVEKQASQLVWAAAELRTSAVSMLREASKLFFDRLKLPAPRLPETYSRPAISAECSANLLTRLDAYFYATWNRDAREAFDSLPQSKRARLGDITEDVFIPGFFKRIYASERRHGFLYLTGKEVYELTPKSEWILSSRVPEIERLILRKGMILVQDSGQLGGLIGRPVMVGRYLDGFSCTNNMVRIVPRTHTDQGYIFVMLNSEYGVRLLTREATGSSIPHLEEKRIKRLVVPWPDEGVRSEIGEIAIAALELRDAACDKESEAIALVEKSIEESS